MATYLTTNTINISLTINGHVVDYWYVFYSILLFIYWKLWVKVKELFGNKNKYALKDIKFAHNSKQYRSNKLNSCMVPFCSNNVYKKNRSISLYDIKRAEWNFFTIIINARLFFPHAVISQALRQFFLYSSSFVRKKYKKRSPTMNEFYLIW